MGRSFPTTKPLGLLPGLNTHSFTKLGETTGRVASWEPAKTQHPMGLRKDPHALCQSHLGSPTFVPGARPSSWLASQQAGSRFSGHLSRQSLSLPLHCCSSGCPCKRQHSKNPRTCWSFLRPGLPNRLTDRHLPLLKKHFKQGIAAYTVQPNGDFVLTHLPANYDKVGRPVLTMGLYEGHAFLIRDIK